MFTKMQTEIIRAVSTVLFQMDEKGKRFYVRKPLAEEGSENDYSHLKGHYFTVGVDNPVIPDDKLEYCIVIKEIDGINFLTIERLDYDEYGNFEDRYLMGYVRLGDPERDKWDMYKYCQAVECILEHGC